jgi:hypothetical protein
MPLFLQHKHGNMDFSQKIHSSFGPHGPPQSVDSSNRMNTDNTKPISSNRMRSIAENLHSATIVGSRKSAAKPNQGNEDRVGTYALSNGCLLWVFDGHGGERAAELCHVNVVSQYLIVSESNKTTPINLLLGEVLLRLNNLVMTSEDEIEDGTTAAIAFYDFESLRLSVAILGDASVSIIDTRDGSIMKPCNSDCIEVFDTHTFLSDISAFNDIPESFTTRLHQKPVGEVHTKESREYLHMGYSFKDFAGITYLDYGSGMISCLRSIGDRKFACFIRNPVTYVFQLSREQSMHATIIATSDGFENHNSLPIGNLAKTLCNPFDAICGENLTALMKDTMFGCQLNKFLSDPVMTESDTPLSFAEKRFRSIRAFVDKHGNIFKSRPFDFAWVDALKESIDRCISFVTDGTSDATILTHPELVMIFVMDLAIAFCSDDSISIAVANVGKMYALGNTVDPSTVLSGPSCASVDTADDSPRKRARLLLSEEEESMQDL